jgi:hypothetical protein
MLDTGLPFVVTSLPGTTTQTQIERGTKMTGIVVRLESGDQYQDGEIRITLKFEAAQPHQDELTFKGSSLCANPSGVVLGDNFYFQQEGR